MNSRAATLTVVLGVLGMSGVALAPLEASVWSEMLRREPALRLESAGVQTRQAMVLGVLGGLRGVVADIVWLEAYGRAEAHDLAGTEALLQLVTVIDPRPRYFWVNGARIMAYDMPGWRVEEAGGHARVSLQRQAYFRRDQAQRALRVLEDARRFHPDSAELWIEQANIELNRLGDVAAAAESYRRAAEQPGAPFYAARLYAELLRRAGRRPEALAWLIKLHPQLPPDGEAAGAELVLARIRELERQLGIPAEQAYRPK